MSPTKKKYTTTEREALAVVYTCKKFQHYLLKYRIVFHTDHDLLKYLVNKPDLLGRIARWILLFQEFNNEIVVKPGKANSNADFLSRQRGQEAVEDISTDFPDEFLETRTQDPEEVAVFYINGRGKSEFQEVIDYLTEWKYLEEFIQEEKIVFQHKVAPYILIRGILFKMGIDDQLRCLEKGEQK